MRSPYHLAMRLVLPLPEYRDIAWKMEYGDVRFVIWIKEQKKESFRFPMRCKVVLESYSNAKIMKKSVKFAIR